VPAGAIPKDATKRQTGLHYPPPLAFTFTAASAREPRPRYAMTGEIKLRGWSFHQLGVAFEERSPGRRIGRAYLSHHAVSTPRG